MHFFSEFKAFNDSFSNLITQCDQYVPTQSSLKDSNQRGWTSPINPFLKKLITMRVGGIYKDHASP